MRVDDLRHFVCPGCREPLALVSGERAEAGRIEHGALGCARGHRFPILGFVPRFTGEDDTTASFGLEWQRHARTQLDSANGLGLSEERFYRQTRWPRDLGGQKILEVGSGAGRFTEIALQTGAQIFSIDASRAVEANRANNGSSERLVLCQADLFRLPFREGYFDKAFCFGVLQHTRDVRGAFAAIARCVRPGGQLAIDCYNRERRRNHSTPEYLIRAVSKRIPHERLYRALRWLVPRLLPLSTWLRTRIPGIGHRLSALIPVSNYHGLLPTDSKKLIEEFSILDTFDTLAARFIKPQRPETVRRWFLEAGYTEIEGDRRTVFSMRGTRLAEAEERSAAA